MLIRLGKIMIFIIILWQNIHLIAQDVHFTQSFRIPQYVNPSFVGNNISPSLSVLYRNHVPAIKTTFVTNSVFYDQYVRFLKGGYGAYLIHDKAGDFSNSEIGVANSYHIYINKDIFLKSGLQFSVIHHGFNLQENNATETETVKLDESKFIFDAAASITIFYEKWFLGAIIKHINEPNSTFDRISSSKTSLKRRYVINMGGKFDITYYSLRNKNMSLTPILTMEKQGDFYSIQYGTSFNISSLITGIWMNHTNDFEFANFSFLIGLNFEKYSIAYSLDQNLSKLDYANFGGHEFSFIYKFGDSDKNKGYKAINYPTF